ncbi:MAG TPA: glutamate-1-semialdehyde 2,1-aminomutase, partial [Burkholderiaceae bacterium]|nr:glutamate-1-semialdehyde 2,1-aminomutase [Burkholderiaceae bacterium]
GCQVWDAAGREYIEYGMGLRAVTLGHTYPEVDAAAIAQLANGLNFNRPTPIEVECAETFLSLIDRAEMVKFTKDGSTATTAALKLARAYTGRDMVALCADHPFFSYDDWFIGTTAMDGGIPSLNVSLTTTFRYNDLASVRECFERHPGRIACVMLEPARTDEPKDDFLHAVRKLCDEQGALLVLDETITGFRWDARGAQHVYGVTPDLSTFGKAMANGYAVSALAGRREVMDLGGIRHARERVFLLSTTHGAETASLAAAMATMRVYGSEPVTERLHAAGARLRAGVQREIDALGLNAHFKLVGRDCSLLYATLDTDGKPSQAFRTLFLQETIARGVIAPSLIVSYSHRDEDIDRTVQAIAESLVIYQRALADGVDAHLVGAAVKPVYRQFN